MRSIKECFLLLLLLGSAQATQDTRFRKRDIKGEVAKDEEGLGDDKEGRRELKGGGKRGRSGRDDDYYYYDDDAAYNPDTDTITLKITNLSFLQPFGPLFVMVHNADAIPLFTLGTEPSVNLQILAETGDPTPLAEVYANAEGVFFSGIYTEGSPWGGGADIFITIPYLGDAFPYLTIAGMALNTNDGFIALNGIRIIPDLIVTGPMYDAGSENNDEDCRSVPGPACPQDSGNVRSGNGEGFVHVHRGFFGLNPDLPANRYDWKNPVMRVELMDPFT